MVSAVYIKIRENGYKYGKYLLKEDILLDLTEYPFTCDVNSYDVCCRKRSKKKVKIYSDGYFLNTLFNEFHCCPTYRLKFLKQFYARIDHVNSMICYLIPAQLEIIDYNW